ncbi:MAG: hypothetical protein AB1696_16045 [Planctomycetota bacterium]
MKRVMTVVGLSVAMILSASMIAEAQRKKKDKEPDLAICKRGNLIFEDDFSKKELKWSFDQLKCKWEIVKGSMATKSFGQPADVQVMVPISPVKDFVFDCKVWVPKSSQVFFWIGSIGGITRPYGSISQHGTLLTASIVTYESGIGVKRQTESSISYSKPGWLNVTFEKLGPAHSLTVGGKRVTLNLPEADETEKSNMTVTHLKKNSDLFAIDDVKVYEALPKDEGEEKDEKGKKKK